MISKQQSRRLVRLIEEYKEASITEVHQPYAYKLSAKTVSDNKQRAKVNLLIFIDQITDAGLIFEGDGNEH